MLINSKLFRLCGSILATLALVTLLGAQTAEAKKKNRDRDRDRHRDRDHSAMITESRDLQPFEEIQFNGIADVQVRFGATQSVTVEAEEDLMPLIITEVDHGVLYIEFEEDGDSDFFGWFDDHNDGIDVTINIVIAKLSDIDARGVGKISVYDYNGNDLTIQLKGVGDVELVNFKGERLALELSGVGGLYADGTVDQLDVQLRGVGEGNLEKLVANSVWAEASGMGDLHVNAVDFLDATARGFGDIVYHGSPKDMRRHTRGFGDIYSYR